MTFTHLARFTTLALIDGKVGAISAPGGRLFRALNLVIKVGKVAEIEFIGDSKRLQDLDLAIVAD